VVSGVEFYKLDSVRITRDNANMIIPGRVKNGVVVLAKGEKLPDGTAVTVSCEISPFSKKPAKKRRVEFPLVPSKHPGTLRLTNKRISEILDQEDVSPRR
jgi:hypothetical protein